MANNLYWATSLTGGGVGALDDIVDGAELADLDGAIVITLGYALFYSLDADSAAEESSPDVIVPDTNPGIKRWILTGISEIPAAAMKQVKNIGSTTISAAQWGIVGALTAHPLGGDGTAGRIPRGSFILIKNGTDAETLKCTVGSRWNGDTIAETDNIVKDATTGDFSLSVDGKTLTIEASGLTGNCVYVLGVVNYNASTTDLIVIIYASGNDICISLRNSTTGADLDITTLVDTGNIYVEFLYITDA